MNGRLVYMGTDPAKDVLGWIATIGTALHYAAANMQDFSEFAGEGRASFRPGTLQDALKRAHELVSPSCPDPI